MKRKLSLLSLLFCTGLAFACAVRALPPFKVDVTLWDIAVAWANGNRTDAANVAFLSQVDDLGTKTFGATAWKRDNFVGYIYPTATIAGSSGATQVYFDKPCDELAVGQKGSGTSYLGGGGGGGGGGGTGGTGGTGGS